MQLEQAYHLAKDLMKQYGLIERGWFFKFDKGRKRFGSAQWKRDRFSGQTVLTFISLSRKLTEINTPERVEEVIRHEIAHALVGWKEGHNAVWKAKAVEVGARPVRCFTEADTNVSYKWQGQCRDCEYIFKAHRLTYRMKTGYHTRCGSKENRGQLSWRQVA